MATVGRATNMMIEGFYCENYYYEFPRGRRLQTIVQNVTKMFKFVEHFWNHHVKYIRIISISTNMPSCSSVIRKIGFEC